MLSEAILIECSCFGIHFIGRIASRVKVVCDECERHPVDGEEYVGAQEMKKSSKIRNENAGIEL